jgi:anion-transporting  ArsA/GET3 family ATPase
MAGMMGMQDMNAEDMSGKLDDMMATIRQVNEQFKNAVSTSIVLCNIPCFVVFLKFKNRTI